MFSQLSLLSKALDSFSYAPSCKPLVHLTPLWSIFFSTPALTIISCLSKAPTTYLPEPSAPSPPFSQPLHSASVTLLGLRHHHNYYTSQVTNPVMFSWPHLLSPQLLLSSFINNCPLTSCHLHATGSSAPAVLPPPSYPHCLPYSTVIPRCIWLKKRTLGTKDHQ